MSKNKFEIKREESFNRIMKAGMEKFCEKGYSATSIQEICEHAGYTKGAFYLHFKSKEDFFLKLLEFRSQIRKDWSSPVDEVDQYTSLEEAVFKRINNFLELMERSEQWNTIYMEFYLRRQNKSEIRQVYHKFYMVWIEENTLFIEQLMKKGWISSEKGANVLAERWHALINGVMIHKVLYDVSPDTDELIEMFLKMVR
ncbi:hypothetical protein CFK37_06515 [Virgibacillus phasianinus]|uniref:HTH tetR-type domain-containing protein n=1 Tax=Virgibacillus phasianinus TaxID=2017483 RepID=A0A220U1C2_9BACI|nr:TetR/AcrR family transcriptional regulator [Virgibacillus phasianinus]ASK61835.1 hypothetical protein CFK37_06515 [Virgibacillus phasianinus]